MSDVTMMGLEPDAAADFLWGAKQIAQYLFGSDLRAARRVYYLTEKRALPYFRMGKALCARKSALTSWIQA